MIYIITYLTLALIVAFISLQKRISFEASLLVSIFATPIVGLIIVLKASDIIKTYRYTMFRTCPACGNKNSPKSTTCSKCGYKIVASFSENSLTFA